MGDGARRRAAMAAWAGSTRATSVAQGRAARPGAGPTPGEEGRVGEAVAGPQLSPSAKPRYSGVATGDQAVPLAVGQATTVRAEGGDAIIGADVQEGCEQACVLTSRAGPARQQAQAHTLNQCLNFPESRCVAQGSFLHRWGESVLLML
jgi:hypothetical protein